jgi:hypothetical protein
LVFVLGLMLVLWCRILYIACFSGGIDIDFSQYDVPAIRSSLDPLLGCCVNFVSLSSPVRVSVSPCGLLANATNIEQTVDGPIDLRFRRAWWRWCGDDRPMSSRCGGGGGEQNCIWCSTNLYMT